MFSFIAAGNESGVTIADAGEMPDQSSITGSVLESVSPMPGQGT